MVVGDEPGVVGATSRMVGVGVIGTTAIDGEITFTADGTVTAGGPLTGAGGAVGVVGGALVGAVDGALVATVVATLEGEVGFELDDSGTVLDDPDPEPPLPDPEEPEPDEPEPDPLSDANAFVELTVSPALTSTLSMNVVPRFTARHRLNAQTSAPPGFDSPPRYGERST
jgi:hypothetical protein